MSNILLINASAHTDTSTSRKASEHIANEIVAELEAADTIVIGTPIYNFAAPATLKAWMDLVARPRVTFHYTSDGPVGRLTGKRAIVVVASGGVKIGSPADHLTPHLKLFLGFIGITDVEFRAAKDVIAPETA